MNTPSDDSDKTSTSIDTKEVERSFVDSGSSEVEREPLSRSYESNSDEDHGSKGASDIFFTSTAQTQASTASPDFVQATQGLSTSKDNTQYPPRRYSPRQMHGRQPGVYLVKNSRQSPFAQQAGGFMSSSDEKALVMVPRCRQQLFQDDDADDDFLEFASHQNHAPPGVHMMTGDGNSSHLALPGVQNSAGGGPSGRVITPQQQSSAVTPFVTRKQLCRGRNEFGQLCLQPADESGFCSYHSSQISGGKDVVEWDERLFIILDLDQTLVYTPSEGEDIPSSLLPNVHYITADGARMRTAIRPHALEFLQQLDTMFVVYVVTGGTPSYCASIVQLLNRLVSVRCGASGDAVESGHKVIREGVSCRATSTQANPKTFDLVLPRLEDQRLALAIDNCRTAWAPGCRDQVVVVPDWAPQLLFDEQENLLRQVFDRVLEVVDRMRRHSISTPHGLMLPSMLGTGEVLQTLYEEEEKARMLRRALNERVDNMVRLMREKAYV